MVPIGGSTLENTQGVRMTFTRIPRYEEPSGAAPADDDECPEVENVVTTAEELEAFYIVRSILRQATKCARIQMKNSPTACSVLLDGDPGKPICRFHFHDMSRRVVLFVQPAPLAESIGQINELYDYAQVLRGILTRYDRDFPPQHFGPDREVMA
jgi:predicted type IV restriction endonuclease